MIGWVVFITIGVLFVVLSVLLNHADDKRLEVPMGKLVGWKKVDEKGKDHLIRNSNEGFPTKHCNSESFDDVFGYSMPIHISAPLTDPDGNQCLKCRKEWERIENIKRKRGFTAP